MKENNTQVDASAEEEVREPSRTRKVTAVVAAGAVTVAITQFAGILAGLAGNWVQNRINPVNKEDSGC